MKNFGFSINNTKVLEKLRNIAFINAKEAATMKAYKIFLKAKEKMLLKFDNHVVTRELLEGMEDPLNTPNLSGTLNSGYGNLYAFIGFINGTDPISPLRELIEESTEFRYSTFRYNKYYFRIRLPSDEQVDSVTPMPWEQGQSWALAIENGISNLSYFLSKADDASRSGGGIQVKNMVNDLQFNTIKYLSEIFSDFKENL